MAATPEIIRLAREYIEREMIPRLPPEVGAVTLEITAWHIQTPSSPRILTGGISIQCSNKKGNLIWKESPYEQK